MTNPNLTLLAFLVDRSGSMQRCKADMEGGLNTLVEEQAKLDGDCEITLAQFDTEYEYVWEMQPIKSAPTYTLVPRGGTALLDAMGKFITEIGEGLAARSENERPSKVVVVVVTDGKENSSKEWTEKSRIKELVEQQKNQYGWEFIFLGANMDAVGEGGGVGIQMANSMTWDSHNPVAVRSAMKATSANLSSYREGGQIQYSEADRAAAAPPPPSKSN